jgi:NADH dehydrogenase
VALGQGDGVAMLGSVKLEGLPAWLTWRGFYLTQLMGFKNRLAVLVEWTSAYFGYRGRARLDIGTTPSPSAEAAGRAAPGATHETVPPERAAPSERPASSAASR